MCRIKETVLLWLIFFVSAKFNRIKMMDCFTFTVFFLLILFYFRSTMIYSNINKSFLPDLVQISLLWDYSRSSFSSSLVLHKTRLGVDQGNNHRL